MNNERSTTNAKYCSNLLIFKHKQERQLWQKVYVCNQDLGSLWDQVFVAGYPVIKIWNAFLFHCNNVLTKLTLVSDKKQTYIKTETCNVYSRVRIFLPQVIKIDLYNFELYCFKVGSLFW